jgi:hypothetical protein
MLLTCQQLQQYKAQEPGWYGEGRSHACAATASAHTLSATNTAAAAAVARLAGSQAMLQAGLVLTGSDAM